MWRSEGMVQFGTDEQRIIVDRVTSQDVLWLVHLDGLTLWPDIDISTTAHRRLLEAALAAGAIEDATRTSDAWRMMSGELRAHHFGDVAACRHTYRDFDQALTALDLRFTLRVRIIGHGLVGIAARQAMENIGATVTNDHPDITVVAGGFHPDAAFSYPPLRESDVIGAPHMPIGVFGNAGFAGPIVIPGETSCLTCHQMHRCDADRCWPVLVNQRGALNTDTCDWPIDLAHALLVTMHAALLIRTWRENPDLPDLWANIAQCIWLPDGSIDVIGRPFHPGCGCTWSPMSEDYTSR